MALIITKMAHCDDVGRGYMPSIEPSHDANFSPYSPKQSFPLKVPSDG